MPETTRDYDGFYYVNDIKGDTVHASISVIIRDFKKEVFSFFCFFSFLFSSLYLSSYLPFFLLLLCFFLSSSSSSFHLSKGSERRKQFLRDLVAKKQKEYPKAKIEINIKHQYDDSLYISSIIINFFFFLFLLYLSSFSLQIQQHERSDGQAPEAA